MLNCEGADRGKRSAPHFLTKEIGVSNSNNHRSKWQRVSRSTPCPICGRPDWCLTTGDSDNPDAVICSRVESRKRVGTKGAGWLHKLRDDPQWRAPRVRSVEIDQPATVIDFAAIAGECFRALGPLRRGVLAEELGVTAQSLERLGVGWSERHRSFSFPMRSDDRGDICYGVRGVRLRNPRGYKWAMPGSRQGLFLPFLLPSDLLVVCEGATDCAAMLDLSFEAVGRPSCTGGVAFLEGLCRSGDWSEVVIMADADAPGLLARSGWRWRSCHTFGASESFRHRAVLKTRDWLRKGATHDDVLGAIADAPALQIRCGVKAVSR